MNLTYKGKTYYQIDIGKGVIIRREIYETTKEVEDRLRNIKKEVGKENIKKFIEENVRILEINECNVINLGKGIDK